MTAWLRLWLIALIAKTGLAIWLPLSNDESYYWVWGHHPQLSYFDHPPMVGWLFWFGRAFENIGSGERLPGVWLGHLTLLIWHELLKPYLSDKEHLAWLAFLLASPFFGVGSLVITPDVPLLFFWSLSILLLNKIMQIGSHDPTQKPSTVAFLYAALGATLGLGFCSKYMIVLFVPIAFIWLFVSGRAREVAWRYVPATLFTGLLASFPVLAWNFEHDWASFRFQLEHGLSSSNWKSWWPIEYLVAQACLLFPTTVWLAIRGARSNQSGASNSKGRTLDFGYLKYFGWLPLAFFFYSSFKAHVEANWPAMAHPAMLALAFLQAPKPSRLLRATIFVWLVLQIGVLAEVAHPWIPIEPERLKTTEYRRFDEFLPIAHERSDFYLGSYQMAAAVSQRSGKLLCKLSGMNRVDFYDYLPECKPTSARFWVGKEVNQDLPSWLTSEGYSIASVTDLNSKFQLVEVIKNAQGSDH